MWKRRRQVIAEQELYDHLNEGYAREMHEALVDYPQAGLSYDFEKAFADPQQEEYLQEWFTDFSPEEASSWLDVGAWNPFAARECERHGLKPRDFKNVHTYLERRGRYGRVTKERFDGSDLLYGLSNYDLDIEEVLEALDNQR